MKSALLLSGLVVMVMFCAQAQNTFQLGSGTATTSTTSPSPVNIYYASSHLQILYTAAELTAAGARAGRIAKMGFYVETTPSYNLPNFSIKLKHTSAPTAAAHDPGPFTQVYSRASYAPVAGGFDMLTLDQSFLWNGQDNLLVDICFDRVPSYSASGTSRYYIVPEGMRYVRSDDQNTCGLETNSTGNEKPQLQIEFAPSVNNDAGIWRFEAPRFFCAGSQQVKVAIANFGANMLNNVQVNWSVNGAVQTPFNHTTPLNPGGQSGSTASVTLGSFNFVSQQVYAFRIWTSNPNGAADGFTGNDTLSLNLAAGLSGNYTIGGAGPNFPSFTAAANALNAYGVCGPVIFKVRNGTYQEQVLLSEIQGASAQNTVTFESELGNPQGVILSHAAISAETNFTLGLQGTKWLRLRQITLEAANNSYGRALVLTQGAAQNRFEGNYFRGPSLTYYSGSNHALVFVSGSNRNENNTWTNNQLENSSYGFYIEGAYNNLLNGIQLSNNQIQNFYNAGIYLAYLNAPLIEGNLLSTASSNSGKEGIYLSNCNGPLHILANRISILNSGKGINLYDCIAGDTLHALIANNFVHIAGESTSYGLYTSYGNYQDWVYNSVHITNTAEGSTAAYSYYGSNKLLQNNILSNKGRGLALWTNTSSGNLRSHHNDLYTRGALLAKWNEQNAANLQELQALSMQDSFSISTDPLFVQDTGFQVVQIALNGAAQPFQRVLTDIQGDPRNSTQPDIGADEFNPPAVDAGLIALAPLNFPFAPGNQQIRVVLKNFGTDPIRSASIRWTINDTLQTDVPWSGLLASKDTVSVPLGSPNFVLSRAYNLKAWVRMPNGAADPVVVNDTVSRDSLYAGLGGNYTIGGTSPNFSTIAQAVFVLNRGGVFAPATFLIRNGTYLEQITIRNIPGAGENAQVVFQSASGDSSSVIISYNNSTYTQDYVVQLENTRWLTFRKLTFRSGTSYYSRIFHLTGTVERLTFENLLLNGENTTSSGVDKAILYGENFTARNLTIRNNAFFNGSYGIFLNSSYNNYSSELRIENNTLRNSYVSGIFVRYVEAGKVRNNTIQSSSAYYNFIGIMAAYFKNSGEISANQVKRFLKGTGLWIESCTGTVQDPIQVFNNFVQGEGSDEIRGIDFRYNNYLHLYHNTVHLLNANAASKSLYSYSGRDNRLVNNILANSGGGFAMEINGSGTFSESDYNDLYTTGQYLVLQNNRFANLADWQAASSGDARSLSVNPRFVNDSSFQVTQIALNRTAKPVGVLTDIQGEPRDMQKPDIGADEFAPPAFDAGIEILGTAAFPFPAGEQDVVAYVKNYGTAPLQSLQIHWKVNGVTKTPGEWSGLLLSNDTTRIILGKVNFQIGTAYTIVAWTSNPNGFPDPVPANDTLSADSLYAGLGGVYSIGGANPDFPNFTAAVTQLTRGGIHAQTIFKVRNGTYTEQCIIRQVPGTDAGKEAIFEGESGDSTAVILTFPNASYNNNYLIQLAGASYIRFKNMTLRPGGASYSRAVVLSDGAHHNTLEHLLLEGHAPNTTSDAHAIVYSYNNLGDANRIYMNRFTGGAYGVYYYAPYNSGNFAQKLEISENSFENQYYRSIYAGNLADVSILNNTFTNNNNYSVFTAIYWSEGKGTTWIAGNKISLLKEGAGIYLTYLTGTADKPVYVANNFIAAAGNSAMQGLSLSSCTRVQVVFNSIHISNTNADCRAFYNYYGQENTVLNNLFINTGGGFAYYNVYNAGILVSNYNDLYSTGANLGYWGGNIVSLAQWKGATARDSNSISVRPRFLTATDLHLTDVALDKTATPYGPVPKDIDGDLRDPVKPDMGADEFYTSANDASVVSVDAPKQPFAATVQPVKVTLFNNGLDTLRTVDVHWMINGVQQAPIHWMGALKSGNSLDSITLGLFPFQVDSAYTIVVYTRLPNGQADEDPQNDTFRVANLYAALGGIYTIGGENPDFPSFTRALNALQKGGVVDAVTFKVRSATYNEQLSFSAIQGTGAGKTITFESESGDSTQVVLQFLANNNADFTIQWNGVSWLRFRKMTLEGTDPNYGRVLDIRGNAHNNALENCVLKTKTTGSSSDRLALVYSGSDRDTNNVFTGNRLVNGSYGFLLYGPNSSTPETGLLISGNRIENAYYTGIYLQYHTAPVVSGNTILGPYNNSSFKGINIRYALGNFAVTGNNLHSILSGVGILAENCQGVQGMEGLIANNFVQTGAGSNYSRGIALSYSSLTKVYYNSVLQTSTRGDALGFISTQGSSIRLLNNIFANTGGGLAMEWQTGGIAVSNFNDLYSSGAQLVKTETKTYDDLTQWKTEAGFDLNSISVRPVFLSNTDLHTAQSDFNGAATPVTEVPTDIDGQTRDGQRPDMGADEFFPIVNNDAGVAEILAPSRKLPFVAGMQEVRVAVKNNGADTLYRFSIEWLADNARQQAYAWSGVLLPGQRDTVLLGSFLFKAGIGHEIIAYTRQPNDRPDMQPSNDTAVASGLFPALAGIYTIGGVLPDFNNFSEAVMSLNEGGVAGPVTFNVRPGIYNEQLTLNRITGASAEKPVIFQAESMNQQSVILRYDQQTPAANFILLLNGTQYVRFQGLQFRTSSIQFATLVELRRGAAFNTWQDNLFRAENNTGSALIYCAAPVAGGSNTFTGNRFENGAYGIFLAGQVAESGNLIEHNQFANQYLTAIYLRNQQDFTIRGNAISSQTPQTNYFGIYAQSSSTGFLVEKNQISAPAGYGIWIYDCRGASSAHIRLFNNFVHVGGSASSTGIYLNYSDYLDIYYNSVNLTNTEPNSKAIAVYSSSHVNLLNNIFSNPGNGYAVYIPYPYGIEGVNFNNYFATGTKLGYWNNTDAANFQAWKALTGKDNQSKSVDPLFVSPSDLHCFQPALDSAATPLMAVREDIDAQTRSQTHPDIGADEFDYLLDDVGVTALLSPASGCALSNGMPVKIRIQNFSGVTLSNFNVAYRINTGQPVVESVGALSIRPGATAEFTFNTRANLGAPGDYRFTVYTLFAEDTHPENDTLSTTVQHLVYPTAVGNMLPANGASGLSTTIAFSWSPSPGATSYDFYLWKNGETQPLVPTVPDIADISLLYRNPALELGTVYNWQIFAKNRFCGTAGPVQTFSLLDLPDLTPRKVQVPSSAFSGQTIELSWEVHNTGKGATGNTSWFDVVYLSADPFFTADVDPLLSSVPNLSALGPGESYANSASVKLPEGISGEYYLFVRTDGYSRIAESDEQNNFGLSLAPTNITLTPPPDLQVTSIVIPNNAFSGSSLNISWTVSNKGSGATRSVRWTDYVYLMNAPVLDPAAATLLGRRDYAGVLKADSSYTQMLTATLPEGISGTFYIHVQTDFLNQEYEHAAEGNNSGVSTQLNIILTPPADLYVQNMTVPPAISNGESFTVTWTVINQGGSATKGAWRDAVYLSPNPNQLLPAEALLLASFYRSQPLQNAATYNANLSVKAPEQLSGNYYVYIHTDADNKVYEFNLDANNIRRATAPIQLRTPDIAVSMLQLPAQGNSGDSLTLRWNLQNAGEGKMLMRWLTESVWLSTRAQFDKTTAVEVFRDSQQVELEAGTIIPRHLSIQLPNGIQGNYYLFVWTDPDDRIYENGRKANNRITAASALNILLSPWIDLQPTALSYAGTANAGQLLPVSYTVRNTGTRIANSERWRDRIYLSNSAVWNPARVQLLRELVVEKSVPLNGAYDNQTTVSLPPTLRTGGYYLFIQTDALNQIYEYTGESNNLLAGALIEIAAQPPVDLAVQTLTAPAQASSGSAIAVQWQVANLAATATVSPVWIDALFLSRDTLYDPDADLLLDTFLRSGPLAPGQQYSLSPTIQLPNGLSGNYYLMAICDYSGLNNDNNRANNLGMRRNPAGIPQTLQIALTPPTDLVISAFHAASPSIAGQTARVIWTVNNRGQGATTANSWSDRFFLSNDFRFDASDLNLGTKVRNGALAAGASYTDTIDLFLPVHLNGNYILIAVTDVNNVVYEHQAEDNNLSTTALVAVQPPPADLRITAIRMPDSALAGASITVEWDLLNQGLNPASGQIQEAVYLSTDPEWQVEDALLGTRKSSMNLAPSFAETHSLTLPVAKVASGDFFILVRTDILNNIPESDENNNLLASESLIHIDVRELFIGTALNDVLPNQTERYYKINVPPGLSGETLLLTLSGDTLSGANEMYLRFGDIPTRVLFDFSHGEALSGRQEIVVPELEAGTYFLLVRGDTRNGAQQQIRLFAEVMVFQVRRVQAAKGGNAGLITLRIDGSKFDPGMTLQLGRSGSTGIQASTVWFIDRTRVYATFDLRGKVSGLYDLMATKTSGASATLLNAFTIEPGGQGQLLTSFTAPASTRPRQIVALQVDFANAGNLDLSRPSVILSSLGGAPIALTLEGLNDQKTELELFLTEKSGPPGILRPGSSGSIIVYARADAALFFTLINEELK